MEKEIKELFDYRIRILRDQTAHKKTDRVPIMANTQQWLYLDAGYSQLEAGRDYAKCEDSGRKFLTKYKVDLLYGADCVRNPTMIYDALGQNNTWSMDESGNNVNAIFEDEMMHADEYDEMIADYEKTVWEKCLMRTFPPTQRVRSGSVRPRRSGHGQSLRHQEPHYRYPAGGIWRSRPDSGCHDGLWLH